MGASAFVFVSEFPQDKKPAAERRWAGPHTRHFDRTESGALLGRFLQQFGSVELRVKTTDIVTHDLMERYRELEGQDASEEVVMCSSHPTGTTLLREH